MARVDDVPPGIAGGGVADLFGQPHHLVDRLLAVEGDNEDSDVIVQVVLGLPGVEFD